MYLHDDDDLLLFFQKQKKKHIYLHTLCAVLLHALDHKVNLINVHVYVLAIPPLCVCVCE